LLLRRENYSSKFKRAFIKVLDWTKATFRGEEYVESGSEDDDNTEDDGVVEDSKQGDAQATVRSEVSADLEKKRERSEVEECKEYGKRAKLDEGTSEQVSLRDTQAPGGDADQPEEDTQTSALRSEAQHYRPLFSKSRSFQR
jgi:hypothetical protein